MIEPHQDQIDGFAAIKTDLIDPWLESFQKYDLLVNKESTIKKLIYQVSFNHVENLSEILAPLEQSLEGVAYVDVEINSLEDAYVKIADGEKEKVDDKQAELSAQKEFEENVKTFMSTKPHSSFCQ